MAGSHLPYVGTTVKPQHGSKTSVRSLSELWSVIPDVAHTDFGCCILDKDFSSLQGSDD